MNTKTKLVTYDDYQNLPDNGKRYEIIGGKLFMAPSPAFYHQIISGNLFRELDRYVSKKSLGRVVYAPMDIVLSMTDIVQPDLFFIGKERSEIITEKNVVSAPDLVVEILSEGTAAIDRSQKKELYEKYGVKEYWIVDPNEKQIEQYLLQGEVFELHEQVEKSETLKSNVIDGFSLPQGKVFAN